ncbi:MAG: hypothetical protein LBS46_03755, partial [Dysgonamonadaceae bacterium]|nr:hypothetical protein [Dysgonamonadaceae bacterium]
GKKYKLTLKFREPKFAASNIYWDNTAQKLTFAPYSETPSSVPENQYQGVFFKFGSLIGISPVGTSWNNSTTLLYVPPTGESDSWYITSANGNLSTLPGNISGTLKNHTTIETGVWEGTDYVAIPHATGGVPVNPPTDRYAIDMPLDSLAEFKGDICKYIDPAYRLPMSYEFGLLSGFFWENENTRYGWTKVGTWSTVTSDKADGTYINTEATGVKYGWTANFFPALGYRAGTSAVLYNTGINGVYWSGSIAFALTNGIAINFNNTEFFWGSTGIGRRNGYSVRCVLQE